MEPYHARQHDHIEEWARQWAPPEGETGDSLREFQDDVILQARSLLLVHLGNQHGWTPADVMNTGLTPLVAWHDVEHDRDDLLQIDWVLPERVRRAVMRERHRLREA